MQDLKILWEKDEIEYLRSICSEGLTIQEIVDKINNKFWSDCNFKRTNIEYAIRKFDINRHPDIVPLRICKNTKCGIKFKPTNKNHEYCSKKCSEYNRRICAECGKKFKSNIKNKVICSNICRVKRSSKLIQEWREKFGVIRNNKEKISTVLKQGRICPGCDYKFPDDELSLLMIFELSHIHNSLCPSNLHDTGGYFYSCRMCNNKTRKHCGVWVKPGVFKEMCREKK